jgi:putative colanic acid biosynthesis UDP-glucose lipid carrier transferase
MVLREHIERVIQPEKSRLNFAYRLVDGVLIIMSLWLSTYLYSVTWSSLYSVAAGSCIGLYYFLAEGFQLYYSWRGAPLKQVAQKVCTVWVITVFCLVSLATWTQTTDEYSRLVVGTWFVAVPLAVVMWREMIRELLGLFRARGFNVKSVAIVGANDYGNQLAKKIIETPSLGYKLVGFFDDRSPKGDRIFSNSQVPIQGHLEDLVELARQGNINVVYITFSLRAEKRIADLLNALADTTVSAYIVPDFFIFNLLHARWVNLDDIPTVSVFETPFLGIDGWLKRIEDIILSVIILTVIAIPMALISVGVKFSSPGPVFFKQRRYGLGGQKIKMWKFRTMTVCEDDNKVVQAKRQDPRITFFGSFLRKTSLDELPQFFNVLQGHMSIVGPRPHAIAHNEEYRRLIHGYMLRHKVKPGITGWAQVNGWRGETENLGKMQKRIEFDLWYIRNWSLWLDIKIIFISLFKGFVGKHAY